MVIRAKKIYISKDFIDETIFLGHLYSLVTTFALLQKNIGKNAAQKHE